jgi:flagellar biosynthesis protein
MESDSTRARAVALRYSLDDDVPKIIAQGEGSLAKRIIQLAQEQGIPIEENTQLIDVLGSVEVGKSIPPETYPLVAEILSFLFRTNEKWRAKKQKEFEARDIIIPIE